MKFSTASLLLVGACKNSMWDMVLNTTELQAATNNYKQLFSVLIKLHTMFSINLLIKQCLVLFEEQPKYF